MLLLELDRTAVGVCWKAPKGNSEALPFRIRSLSPGAAVGEGVMVIARMPLLGSACQHLEG